MFSDVLVADNPQDNESHILRNELWVQTNDPLSGILRIINVLVSKANANIF